MSSHPTKTKAAALAAVQALIAGTQKRFPSGSFTLGNVAYTTASLVTLLQSVADAMTALNAAQLAAKHALSTLQGALVQAGPIIQVYVRFLQATFANTVPALADFGLAPPKQPAPMTSEQYAARAAKARATREARGTTSPKQKLTVKGNVTGITVTAITAPTEPAPTVSTASSAPTPATAGVSQR